MRSIDDHTAAALALASVLGTEEVPLSSALGRALAADVVAAADAPPFANSSMDGYAVAAASGGAGQWAVSQDVRAGVAPAALAPGTVARIMTGAPIPAGADAVVPVENTDAGVGRVQIMTWPRAGAYVRDAGADMRAGDVVVKAPRVLRAVDLAACAAAGAPSVTVHKVPRVGVLITGDELRAPGTALEGGAIYDASSTTLPALIAEAGATCVGAAVVADDEGAVLSALDDLADAGADLVVTAGGVSAGAFDVVKSALAPRGVWFGPVAMQPGKPQGLGRWGEAVVVCAPGNPVSVVATFLMFVSPILRRMQGLEPRAVRHVRVAGGWTCPPGRAQLMPVRITPGGVVPATPQGSGSHLIGSLSRAEAFALVDAETDEVRPGDTVALMELNA